MMAINKNSKFNKTHPTRLELTAMRIKHKFSWISNPLLLVTLSLVVTHVVDILMSPLVSFLILFIAGVDADVSLGQDDLGMGVTVMGTVILIYIILFPFLFWVCVKKMFKLFHSERN